MDNTKVFRKDEWIIDIFIHVILVITVLSVFFWLVLSKIETKSLQGEVTDQLGNLIDKKFKPNDATKTMLKSIDYDELSKLYNGKPSREVEDYNKALFKLNIIIIVLLFGTFILIWILLKINCGKDVPVGKIFLENIGLFILIGIIEVLFFIKIASRFIPVEPSFIMKTVKENISDKAKKKN